MNNCLLKMTAVILLCAAFSACKKDEPKKTEDRPAPLPQKDLTFTVSGVSFKMVEVEGGTFRMGATSEQEGDAYKDESPAHDVTLSTYRIGETEVTQALWNAVMGSNPSTFQGNDRRPVENVSWEDCQSFISKLNGMLAAQLNGQKFCLPTEAQWEYAARGGKKSKDFKYSGSLAAEQVAWLETNSGDSTQAVGSKEPNELGLYDMSGNVFEWCWDWYGSYDAAAQTDPTGSSSKSSRVIRGGSWKSGERMCRVSYRNSLSPSSGDDILGLRLALVPEEQAIKVGIEDNVFSINEVDFEMIPVEGGNFQMGATGEQGSDAREAEKPVHIVGLGDFLIGETEVTQALWEIVMGSNPSRHTGNGNFPAENMTRQDCDTFVQALNRLFAGKLDGMEFRLPTEAQWEYAARGGKKSKAYKYSGSKNAADVAWYNVNSASNTQEVAQKAPNELGLYDMSGNVSERCQDMYGEYDLTVRTNPLELTGDGSGYWVNRGGSYDDNSIYTRVSCRGMDKGGPDKSLGLRLVLVKSGDGEPPVADPVSVNGQHFRVCDVDFDMVFVDGEIFQMGCDKKVDSDAEDNEAPLHYVRMSSFSIGRTEVTQALWKAVMGSNPSHFTGNDKCPVENVSWNDCQEFVRRLNVIFDGKLDGRKFRLPTEAQWEFAARGGKWTMKYKYSGSNNAQKVAWYDANSGICTQAVAKKDSNELGLYDMSGNVWEWCQDMYGKYTSDSQHDPVNVTGDSEGHYVRRGGGYSSDIKSSRVAYRSRNSKSFHEKYIGMRLALQ